MSSFPVVVPTPVTNAQMRTDFPEFANTTIYPDSMLTYWLSVATLLTDPNRWARLTGVGIELFAAHNLVLEAQALATVSVGGAPGLQKGPISSESVGAVSVNYDVASGVQKDAAHWNMTIYGTRYMRMVRIFGSFPLHLGTGIPVGAGTGISSAGPPFIPF